MRHFLLPLLALAATACASTPTDDRRASAMVAPILTSEDARDERSYARPAEARVTHTALDLNADFEAKRFSGTATLDVQAAPGAREIVLDSNGLEIRSVTDGGGRALPWAIGANDGDNVATLTIQLGGARRIRIS